LKEAEPTLCAPDAEKSCFACCPPIRPAGYEHIRYKSSVRRMLLENTESFRKREQKVSPITGFSCWALGFLDGNYKQVGCLLHPARNGGTDLRSLVDYGEKCRRESCEAAKVFLKLAPLERKFWLQLTEGLDAFSYSSARINPLFKLTGWGADLLREIAREEGKRPWTKETFFSTYAFFTTRLDPRGNAYLLRRFMENKNLSLLKTNSFRVRFEAFSAGLVNFLMEKRPAREEGPYVHTLSLDRTFLDFLRLGLSLSRIPLDAAASLKAIVDREIEAFREEEGRT